MQIKKSPLSAQLRLSERRARAAADWLVKNAGFKADQISTKGFGEAAVRAENRRGEPPDESPGRDRRARLLTASGGTASLNPLPIYT